RELWLAIRGNTQLNVWPSRKLPQQGREHFEVGLRGRAAAPADHDSGLSNPVNLGPEGLGVHTGRDDGDAIVMESSVVLQVSIPHDDLGAHPTDRCGLPGKLEPAEASIDC